MSASPVNSKPEEPRVPSIAVNHPVAEWLSSHSGQTLSALEIIDGTCRRLRESGVPIERLRCVLDDVHPQIEALGISWTPEEGALEALFAYREGPYSNDYLDSPIKAIDDGVEAIRRRLHRDDCAMDYPVLRDLRDEGMTDYLAMALVFSDGTRNFISWATNNPDGFSDDQLVQIDGLTPLLAMRLEIERQRHTTRTLLCTYLGHAAAERVIKGTIRRFQCESMNAIILYSDLRGFTELADRLDPAETIRTLGLYYEAIAEPIQYFNGDIVKIIGDGVLAIFPVEKDAPREKMDHVACGANAGVKRAMGALAAVGSNQLPAGVDSLRAGFALHAGEVAFGNVGSQDRLDFTVIGSAVNEVVRVEALTKTLGFPVLTTATFASLECTVKLESVGFHHLRGVSEPKELFRPVEL